MLGNYLELINSGNGHENPQETVVFMTMNGRITILNGKRPGFWIFKHLNKDELLDRKV